MIFKFDARADWRALSCAALVGAGVGLALGAAYLAGGLARTAGDHLRAERLAQAAADGFSETLLQRTAAEMGPGALRVARRHDPFTTAGAAQRDRQSAILAERLEERREKADKAGFKAQAGGFLRASLGGAFAPAAAPFHLAGVIDSSRELDCLTNAVYFEARGEGRTGQQAVAQVVLNRVRHPAFPKSVCAVVFQGAGSRGCQFSFACDGSMRRARETGAWRRAREVAARALGGFVMAEVGQATHFHTVNVSPNWGPRLMKTAQVGLHVFYRFGRGAPRAYFAKNDASAPELAPRPVYAGLGPAAAAQASETPILMAMTVTEAPGVGGPAEAAVEPASAPTEAKPAASRTEPAGPPTPMSDPAPKAAAASAGAL